MIDLNIKKDILEILEKQNVKRNEKRQELSAQYNIIEMFSL